MDIYREEKEFLGKNQKCRFIPYQKIFSAQPDISVVELNQADD